MENTLREAILGGVIIPGSRLNQTRLSELLEVSRSPVTVALRELEGEGLVDWFPQRGAFVRKLSLKEIEEIYQLRILLGKYLLKAVAERVTAKELDDLEAIARKITKQEDRVKRYQLTERFYQRLYKISDQSKAADFINKIRADQGRYLLILKLDSYTYQNYEVIIQSIRKNKLAQAEKLLEEHLKVVFEQLKEKLLRQYAEAYEQ